MPFMINCILFQKYINIKYMNKMSLYIRNKIKAHVKIHID